MSDNNPDEVCINFSLEGLDREGLADNEPPLSRTDFRKITDHLSSVFPRLTLLQKRKDSYRLRSTLSLSKSIELAKKLILLRDEILLIKKHTYKVEWIAKALNWDFVYQNKQYNLKSFYSNIVRTFYG